ncbi:C-type lectin domain family 9 member A-like isoform X1 [Silurus asotus]|uniref:C-type lectin domain family 9 member A-like isoform X1 n=1 Tax=Silurus asotus TaxID=30991 RepID=A0AAD5AM09_SILAS|nr:C-type lectin domain family 9 member A-like isoform X1 [Silurus asotus]
MAHRILLSEKAVLETEKGELLVQRDQFKNSWRQLITGFSTSFPVGKYCTLTNEEVYCSACMKYWYQNGSSCYLFKTQSWLTWTKSQEYCSEIGGYLVVIDSQEKQEYISQHINDYYDTYRGFWIGLAKKENMWIWSTGAEVQSNGSWTKPPGNSQAGCVLLNPNKDNLNKWDVKECSMLNRYICEMKAMVWPSQM